MEGISAVVYRGIRGYWRRRSYQRLRAGDGDGGANRRRRLWKIKLTPRLKLKLRFSPKKFLLGLRDAYVSMMMRVATTRAIGGGSYGGDVFGMRAVKEYDERTIVEIYKSMVVAQGQLVPRDAAWICSGAAACRR
ncbi:uncharacterized protein LOC127243007 [Andrographis paniculata]|uniref:uncharacterized protein LOC127243007 n=1 Tax=Andrographis paniculata TaxID=175694 RepID=UPI0021E9926D|nr:uncharacterized protein LOC127243007 [Andrographis paniculata]